MKEDLLLLFEEKFDQKRYIEILELWGNHPEWLVNYKDKANQHLLYNYLIISAVEVRQYSLALKLIDKQIYLLNEIGNFEDVEFYYLTKANIYINLEQFFKGYKTLIEYKSKFPDSIKINSIYSQIDKVIDIRINHFKNRFLIVFTALALLLLFFRILISLSAIFSISITFFVFAGVLFLIYLNSQHNHIKRSILYFVN